MNGRGTPVGDARICRPKRWPTDFFGGWPRGLRYRGGHEQTGVLTVHRIDGFDEVTTHYSPSAWASVTHRIKGSAVRRPSVGAKQ